MDEWTIIEEKRFCESYIYGIPEYVNSFTSIFIFIFGLLLIYINNNTNIIIRFIASSFTITGIGSFYYHWTFHRGAGLMDTLPMLVSSYLGAYMSLDIILYKIFKKDHGHRAKLGACRSEPRERSDLGANLGDRRSTRDLYEILSGTLCLLIASGLYISIIFVSLTDSNNGTFDILFAIPNILILFGSLFIRFYIFAGNDNLELKKSFIYLTIGLSSIIFSAILWIITELTCEVHTWTRYLYAHGIWHIGVSYGFYNLIIFFIFINAFIKDRKPFFNSPEGGGWALISKIIPSVKIRENNVTKV